MKTLDLKNPFGGPVYHEEIVSSTFDAARLLERQKEPNGTVITADYQEAGRGRQGRPWAAERGSSLLFTLLLRWGEAASIPRALTLRIGLGVSLAVEDLAPALCGSVFVKWPNDIMIRAPRGRAGSKAEAAFKAAGILTEADGGNVFIGIGVNVSQREFSGEYVSKAGSLIQACPDLGENSRFTLLEKILARLYEELEVRQNEDSWQERLTKRLYKKGEVVCFAEGAAGSQALVEGTLTGIGKNGDLLIIPAGEDKERSFVTGELRVYSWSKERAPY